MPDSFTKLFGIGLFEHCQGSCYLVICSILPVKISIYQVFAGRALVVKMAVYLTGCSDFFDHFL